MNEVRKILKRFLSMALTIIMMTALIQLPPAMAAEDNPAAGFTATFDANGGSEVDELPGIAWGDPITAPPAPVKEGYTFAGWYQDSGCRLAWNFTFDTVISDTTLYAKWKLIPIPETYTVTFDTKGGSKVEAVTGILADQIIAKPPAPTRPGYDFTDWYKDSGGRMAWGFSKDTIIADTTIYAGWSKNYKVRFHSKGGSEIPALVGVKANSMIKKPKKPVRAGHTFAGWYCDAKYWLRWDFGRDVVREDTKLYAKWKPKSIKLTFDAGKGRIGRKKTITVKNLCGSKIIPVPKPIRPGYTFMGWHTKKSGGVKITRNTKTPPAPKTYHAHWLKQS